MENNWKGTKRPCCVTETEEGYAALSASGRYEFAVFFSKETGKKDAELCSDALNTVQECGLMPSVLKQQRDELLQQIEAHLEEFEMGSVLKELIKKIKG